MANEKLRELVVKWRKTITDCPAVNREKWGQVFDAVSTCANELEAALAAEEPADVEAYKKRIADLEHSTEKAELEGLNAAFEDLRQGRVRSLAEIKAELRKK